MQATIYLAVAAALSGLFGTAAAADAGPRVTELGRMSAARATHQATVLASGHVLITGGCSGQCDVSLATAERYDPATRTFQRVASMTRPRHSHVAIALPDGRVLVAGGWVNREVTASTEIFDPASGRFTSAGDMKQPRAAALATRLPDGRVLITGGVTSALEPVPSAEIFDPATSGFKAAGPMQKARVGHAAVALEDGRVLIIGGRQVRRGETLQSAEIFDPASGQFQATGQMSFARHKHAAIRLADGRVLVIGGSDARDQQGRYQSTELYDPGTGEFTAGADMRWRRFKLTDAVALLPSGAVLVAGGAARLELYDPRSQAFSTLEDSLGGSREFATASLLPGGDVLVLGGYDEQIRTSAAAWLVRVPPGLTFSARR
jgi:hypothetical protein